MTDSSKDGPEKDAPAIMPAGMMGDRAAVIFVAPGGDQQAFRSAMLNGDGIAVPFGPAGVRGGGGAFVAGALVAYAWYLFVHHCAHHGPDKLPLPLLKHHQSHHRFATRNYGVSTTLWDHVFGTMLG
jgi:hypothetical protein